MGCFAKSATTNNSSERNTQTVLFPWRQTLLKFQKSKANKKKQQQNSKHETVRQSKVYVCVLEVTKDDSAERNTQTGPFSWRST